MFVWKLRFFLKCRWTLISTEWKSGWSSGMRINFKSWRDTIKVEEKELLQLQFIWFLYRNYREFLSAVSTKLIRYVAILLFDILLFSVVLLFCYNLFFNFSQGMDAVNERRIFELIVNITGRNDSSQYFLLTPKVRFLKWSKFLFIDHRLHSLSLFSAFPVFPLKCEIN